MTVFGAVATFWDCGSDKDDTWNLYTNIEQLLGNQLKMFLTFADMLSNGFVN